MSASIDRWDLSPFSRAVNEGLERVGLEAVREAAVAEQRIQELGDRSRSEASELRRAASRLDDAIRTEAPLPRLLESSRVAWRAEESAELATLEERRQNLAALSRRAQMACESTLKTCASMRDSADLVSRTTTEIAAVEEEIHAVLEEATALVRSMSEHHRSIERMARELR
jgi:hypothetical protein